MTDYTPPTQDEIQRVAQYWERVKRLSCEHNSGFNFEVDTMVCADCHQPIRLVTAEQIENLRNRPPLNPDVRNRLLQQMDRGGVRFAVDGQWYDVRFEAWGYDGSDPETEKYGMQAKDIALMLRATEA
jgi:hypothetical protein